MRPTTERVLGAVYVPLEVLPPPVDASQPLFTDAEEAARTGGLKSMIYLCED